ncbi:MAG: alpha-L-fucosidase [Prevotellaceae bacterium]|jgi:alpha-L-fucosidase|nr:alpha-L-fucosidase [Prevotellaceae bacterium]
MRLYKLLLFTSLFVFYTLVTNAQTKSLKQLQQEFFDLRFGMFIHYNIPTYAPEDWPDPDASPSIFNPTNLDCSQWAKAAKSANMSYGCLTAKHHSGFCIWDTKTTGYNVMNSPYKADVVKKYVEAFRKEGLKVMLYYSILDTHHRLRPNMIKPDHINMVKSQIAELLTNYGEITALIIDGWDAPWSRISYDEIPFEDIYLLVKSLQPNCLLMDLNAAKYPGEVLYYTDIKSYEQGAGQHISNANRLPALSCYPIQETWFWKESFPNKPVKSPKDIVEKNIIPLNKAYCNFILNIAPNRDGLIDNNALEALKEIGSLWKNEGSVGEILPTERPIISSNIAKKKPTDSSWSYDWNIMDFANDDLFNSAWISHPSVEKPWLEITLGKNDQEFNMVVIAEPQGYNKIEKYRLEYFADNEWRPILAGTNTNRIKIHRFNKIWGSKVRILIDKFSDTLHIAEFGVYNER